MKYEVINSLILGDNLAVTVGGKCEDIKNGSIIKDESGNSYRVISVGMPHHADPKDIGVKTELLIEGNNSNIGKVLIISK